MSNLTARLVAALTDRYRIERELGTGGMATVYLAEDVKHHRKVAVKVLRPELASVVGPERFLREIEIAATLNHPHILPLLPAGRRRWRLDLHPGPYPPRKRSSNQTPRATLEKTHN